jgi:hypothetical protein
MNAGTTATITNLTDPTNAQDAATKAYVDTSIANVIDSAPAALDTLNELAAALGDDANFATTVTDSIATKLPLAGGTMTGAIAMSTNKITGLGDPTANQDAATKVYVDTQRDTRLALSGGTMTGAIDMGANKITTTYTPTDAADLTTKTYVDGILGSATAAAASAAAAATSESNAATSETNAANSASAAATSEANAAASYDSFDDRYLGAKATAPTLDNDGDALIIGALYFNTSVNLMYVYSSAGWVPAGSSVNGTSDRVTYTATSGQTVFAATYDTGYVDVYLNGVKLVAGTDFTATNGTSITLATGATTGDVVDIVAYGTFVLADHYTEAQSDARFVNVTGDTMTGNLDVQGSVTADGLTVDGGGSFTQAGGGLKVLNNGTAGYNANIFFGVPNQTDGWSLGQGIIANDGVFRLYDNGAGNVKMSATTGGDISFYEDTGTTPKFFWDASAESLGIGTTSPAYKLDVSGAIQSSVASGNGAVYINNSSLSGKFWTLIPNTSSAESDLLFFYGGASAGTRLTLTNTGNVGIGTTSPSNLLHLYKASGGNYSIIENTSGKAAFGVGSSGEVTISAESASNPIRFLTSSGGTERMRLDASGNLLVGMTTASTSDDGVFITPAGYIRANNDDITAYFNRMTTDGDIVQFRKDNTTVGSIGVDAGDNLYIGSTAVNHGGIYMNDTGVLPMSGGSLTDNTRDLGGASNRWNDLFLGGGVYLGGTGSANYLDDYEEGTWTPTLYGSSTSGSTSGTLSGNYTKIGNLVHVVIRFVAVSKSGATGNLIIGGFPFTSVSGAAGGGSALYLEGFNPAYKYTVDADSNILSFLMVGTATYGHFRPSVSPNWDNYVDASATTWTGGGGSTYGQMQVTYYAV